MRVGYVEGFNLFLFLQNFAYYNFIKKHISIQNLNNEEKELTICSFKDKSLKISDKLHHLISTISYHRHYHLQHCQLLSSS